MLPQKQWTHFRLMQITVMMTSWWQQSPQTHWALCSLAAQFMLHTCWSQAVWPKFIMTGHKRKISERVTQAHVIGGAISTVRGACTWFWAKRQFPALFTSKRYFRRDGYNQSFSMPKSPFRQWVPTLKIMQTFYMLQLQTQYFSGCRKSSSRSMSLAFK